MNDAGGPGSESTLPYSEQGEGGVPAPIKIGRYLLLELVGTGGMGMVWGAWDPELERRVALKLVRSASRDARDRMQREGQVLARLSHPNIVPIFDVGTMGEQIYLVMEWIRGTTLRALAADHPERRQVLTAYRDAAAGLAAAHDAGVIHRDFKPANAILGADGRTRVLDFGIAHEVGEQADIAGTPRYMAPEQLDGEAVTVACDQYAFCLSLREALEASGDVPGWLAAIVERGTQEDPSKRFASMHELLDALARDPARRWRRISAGVLALAASGAAFAIGRARSAGTAVEPCSGGAGEIAASWNPALRAKMTAHLDGLGPLGHGEAGGVARELDGYATDWIGEHRQACLANERGELSVPRYEARLGCLVRARSQLAATGELMSGVAAGDLAAALLAARSLPDVHACADASGLVAPPPAAVAARVKEVVPHVERALVRAAAKQSDAITDARAATAEARATGYTPLIARALLVEGRAATVNSSDARTTFAEAMQLALRASDDATAVEAYARWVFELARNGETSFDGWPMMTEVAQRTGRPARFARALMYNNAAVGRTVAEDKPGARALLQQAQDIAGDAPELELVSIAKNLATLEDDPAACARQLASARDRLQRALGPTHPDVLLTRVPLALLTRDRHAARAELDEVCHGFERWQHTTSFALCAFEAAWLADEDGDTAAARTWMTHVTSAETGDLKPKIAAAYLAVVDRAKDRDARLAELAQLAAAPHANWWQRLDAADALTVIALADPHVWAQVVPMIESVGQPFYARRVARARRMLAEQWQHTHPVEAAALATRALAWYGGAPGDEAVVSHLAAIAATAPGPASR